MKPGTLRKGQQPVVDRRLSRKHVARRALQWMHQNEGTSRYAARRQIFGPTRKEATSHPTRGQLLNQMAAVNREHRRWRRRQMVAAAIATAEASW